MAAARSDAPDRRHAYTGRIAIRWGDMDALGHLNNATYLTLLEQVRTDWLAALPGADDAWTKERGPVVAHAAVTYKRPIVYPATVMIDIWAEEPRRSSLVFYYELRTADAPDVLCAAAETTLVWVSYETGRPVSLPDAFRAMWERSTPQAP